MSRQQFTVITAAIFAGLLGSCDQNMVPWPDVDMNQYRISLVRSACHGTCPDYRVLIEGGGRVTFVGRQFVHHIGTKVYSVPQSDVAQLIRDIKRYAVLAAEEEYGVPVDAPVCIINIRAGPHEKVIWSGCGTSSDIPIGITKFHKRIDEVGQTAQFEMTDAQRNAVYDQREAAYD
jgi:Domain of unknown function (DUF6438)